MVALAVFLAVMLNPVTIGVVWLVIAIALHTPGAVSRVLIIGIGLIGYMAVTTYVMDSVGLKEIPILLNHFATVVWALIIGFVTHFRRQKSRPIE